MKLVGMNIVPARNLGNARLSSKALLNKPQLLSRSPSPPSLRTGKNRNRRHVCPLTCKLMGKHSHAPRHPGRWCSPDAYSEPSAWTMMVGSQEDIGVAATTCRSLSLTRLARDRK